MSGSVSSWFGRRNQRNQERHWPSFIAIAIDPIIYRPTALMSSADVSIIYYIASNDKPAVEIYLAAKDHSLT